MESSWISHGLSSISAYAKNEGYNIDLIDLRKLKNWAHFSQIINIERPDVVGLTMMSVDYNPVMKCIEIIKKIDSAITIVVGGAHPTLALEEVTENKKIDHVITGEGEISFAQLLYNLERGINIPRIIPGIRPHLNEVPFIDRNLFGPYEYPIADFLSTPFMTIISARGCTYNCSFCQPAERIIFGSKVRRRSAKNIIAELRLLEKKYHFRSLMIHDDCFIEDREQVTEFCDQYQSNGFTQPFVCQTRADLICKNEDVVEMLSKVGLRMFLIGFESGNQRILNLLRKGTTVEQNYRAAQICRKYGIRIWANYMLGIPTETKEEVMDTVRMIRKIKPYWYSPAYYTPHAGSDLYRYCLDRNLSLVKDHDDYRRNPSGAKIKGQNYRFLEKALLQSIGVSSFGRMLRKVRKIVRQFLPENVRIQLKDILRIK